MTNKSPLLLVVCLLAVGALTNSAHADQLVWAMAAAGNGHLYQIDANANTSTLIGSIKDPLTGDVGGGWSTVAETPDKTLYFLRRYVSDINVYALDSTNIHVTGGIIDNLHSLGATGLAGNLDGLTAGPDGNIYMSAYDNSAAGHARNGLFRFHPSTGTLDFVGTFAGDAGPGGANSFYTDLAFDPLTGDLFGTGYDRTGAFSIYRLPGSDVLTGANQVFTFVRAFGAWGADGIAFDRVTGQLYESSDTGGVAEINRTTGQFVNYLANTGGTEIGTDLAVQSDTISGVPEPGSVVLLGTAAAGALLLRRRQRRSAK